MYVPDLNIVQSYSSGSVLEKINRKLLSSSTAELRDINQNSGKSRNINQPDEICHPFNHFEVLIKQKTLGLTI